MEETKSPFKVMLVGGPGDGKFVEVVGEPEFASYPVIIQTKYRINYNSGLAAFVDDDYSI